MILTNLLILILLTHFLGCTGFWGKPAACFFSLRRESYLLFETPLLDSLSYYWFLRFSLVCYPPWFYSLIPVLVCSLHSLGVFTGSQSKSDGYILSLNVAVFGDLDLEVFPFDSSFPKPTPTSFVWKRVKKTLGVEVLPWIAFVNTALVTSAHFLTHALKLPLPKLVYIARVLSHAPWGAQAPESGRVLSLPWRDVFWPQVVWI